MEIAIKSDKNTTYITAKQIEVGKVYKGATSEHYYLGCKWGQVINLNNYEVYSISAIGGSFKEVKAALHVEN